MESVKAMWLSGWIHIKMCPPSGLQNDQNAMHFRIPLVKWICVFQTEWYKCFYNRSVMTWCSGHLWMILVGLFVESATAQFFPREERRIPIRWISQWSSVLWISLFVSRTLFQLASLLQHLISLGVFSSIPNDWICFLYSYSTEHLTNCRKISLWMKWQSLTLIH